MNKIKILIIISIFLSCSSYHITDNKITNQKKIIWIYTTIESENNEDFIHPNDSVNLSLKIVNKLNNSKNQKEFRVLYNKDQKDSNSLIDIQIKKIYSKIEIPEESILPTILTAGLFLVFGGDSHEDYYFAKIEISIYDKNNNQLETKATNFVYKRPYSFYSYIFPFIDYRFLNLSSYNPSHSKVFLNFISDNIINLIKNEI